MPERESTGTNKDDILRLGLERVGLMFLAEEDAERIRTTWAGLDAESVENERLARDVKEMQGRIDRLSPTSTEEAT